MVAPSLSAEEDQEEVVAILRDGRTVGGLVDSRTNSASLWIRCHEPGIVLRSRFAWDEVLSVESGGRAVDIDSLKQGSDATSALSKEFWTKFWSSELLPTAPHQLLPVNVPEVYVAESRAASLEVSGRVASWDRDPEFDGILVEVKPLTRHGFMIPVDGQIRLTLVGRAIRVDPQQDLRRRGDFPILARRSILVSKADFVGGPAIYKLPFGTTHPEFRLDTAPQALLTVNLSVPQQGTFQSSDGWINLRPASPLRDWHQQLHGTRYFPEENARSYSTDERWYLD